MSTVPKNMMKTLQACCEDLKRALREHNPGAEVASCSCGNIALAFVQDRELGLRYARCLACGANVSLQFIEPDAALALKNGTGSTVVRAEEDPSEEERRDWAAEDKHDLDKEGAWEDP